MGLGYFGQATRHIAAARIKPAVVQFAEH
jgi:hypothetical protein